MPGSMTGDEAGAHLSPFGLFLPIEDSLDQGAHLEFRCGSEGRFLRGRCFFPVARAVTDEKSVGVVARGPGVLGAIAGAVTEGQPVFVVGNGGVYLTEA